MVEHSDLDDENFLALTGMEYAFVEKDDYFSSRTIEIYMYAKNQRTIKQACYNLSYVNDIN